MCLVAHSCRPGQQRRSASWALRGGSCGVARGAREEDDRDCRGRRWMEALPFILSLRGKSN